MNICSLLPRGTAIAFALGLGDAIVGVTDLCDFPEEATKKPIVSRSRIEVANLSSAEVEAEMRDILESGGSPYVVDEELFVNSNIDVVLTQDLCYFCEVDVGTVEKTLVNLDILPEVLVLNPRTLDEILTTIDQIGEACRAPMAARQLLQSMRERIGRIVHGIDAVKKRPKVFSIEGVDPLVIGGHWIADVLNVVGVTAYQSGCDAQRIKWQEVVEYAPDKLFIDLCSSDINRNAREVSWLVKQDGWYDVPAVQHGEVYLIDHVYLSRPGPRIVNGLEILAQLTYPDDFQNLIPKGSVAKLDTQIMNASDCINCSDWFTLYE